MIRRTGTRRHLPLRARRGREGLGAGGGAAGAGGAAAGAAVRVRHSLRKSAYFLSPTVPAAFIPFHSSLQVFMRLCALAGAAENTRPAQIAAAQNATRFFMTSPR